MAGLPAESDPAFVSTVGGPIAPEALGVTLPHEHLIACFATPDESDDGWSRLGRARPTAAADAQFYESAVTIENLGALNLGRANRDNATLDHELLAVAEAGEFAARGGGAIVDQTSIGLGRNPAALRRIAESAGIAVVMAAGWHHPDWTPEIEARSAASLAEQIEHELRHGIDGIRAGVIGRIGALDPRRPAERRLLDAVGFAAQRTGAPISIDRSPRHADTLAVLDILDGHGVAPGRIALGDCTGLVPEPGQLDELAARGVLLQFDSLGRIPTVLTEVSDHAVAEAIIALAGRGHADRLLASQGLRAKIDLTAFGGNGYGFLLEQYLPYLRAFGADDALIAQLTEANPRCWLTVQGARA